MLVITISVKSRRDIGHCGWRVYIEVIGRTLVNPFARLLVWFIIHPGIGA